MGIADLFRPKYRHSDAKVRTEAVRALTHDDDAVLTQIARTDHDPGVRRIAIEKLQAAEVLAAIARADDESALRDLAGARAAHLWAQIACGDDPEAATTALDGLLDLGDQRALGEVAGKASADELRGRALAALRDAKALAELARTAADVARRLEAVARIDDGEVLRALAVDTTHKEVGIAAVDRLDDDDLLGHVGQKAKSKHVRQRARKRMGERAEAAKAARPKKATEHKRRHAAKAQLLRTIEKLAETFEWDHSLMQLRAAEEEWERLGDVGEPHQDERFARAVERYEQRRKVHFEAMEAHAHHAAEVRTHAPAPARDEAPAAEPARQAAADDGEAASRREDREQRRAEDEARRAAEAADKEARRAEAAERGKQIAASLDALCGEMEQMLASSDGRAIGRLIDQATKAFEQVGKVAGDERAALTGRYDDVRARLVIRVQELREAEDWQRWANVPRAEGLVTEADQLAAAEAPTLPQLKDLQQRWKAVGPIPQKKSKELWERFKGSCDAAYVKIKGAREAEKAQWGENAAARERLVAEAEAVAESTEWDATANRLKAMQAEWKQLGPVPRKQGDALWKKFRGACDRFFERRKPVLDARTAELVENLEHKERLCAKVEALVEAAPGDGGWGAAIKAVKAAQRDWKDIGFVPRRDADAIYARFRAACDGLFAKRDQARDAEAEALRAEVEAVRGAIEAVLAGDGGAAKALEVHRTLRALAERDLRPGPELAALYDRMVRTVAASAPGELAGTELDPAAMERRREKLVTRVRELAPAEEPAMTGAESPQEVADKLRAALASNALGGLRMDRDPREIVDELRAEWAQIGPVLDAAGEALAAAFEQTCARVVAAAGGEREVVDEDDGDRGGRGRRRREGRGRRSREIEVAAAAEPPGPGAPPEAPDEPAPEVPQAAPEVPQAPDERPAIAPVEVPASEPAPAPEAPPMLATAPAPAPASAPDPMATPIPAPPRLPDVVAAPDPEPAPRHRSITEPPPSDPVDDSWD
jgi:Domain of Unknown Function (DUF349)